MVESCSVIRAPAGHACTDFLYYSLACSGLRYEILLSPTAAYNMLLTMDDIALEVKLVGVEDI